jgi:S-formylglutathione hydrolase FrmB
MAFFDCHFFSDVLGLTVTAHVLVPQKATGQIGMTGGETRERYPTLYLLHGLSDDHTIWSRRTSIERYAAEKNLAVIMPAAGRSFYQDMASGPRYWTFISEELPAIMRRFFPLSDKREETYAAGLSMGGYGALRLGLTHPDRFAAIASLSGALDVVRACRTAGRAGGRISEREIVSMFGPDLAPSGTGADLWHLAQQLANRQGPKPGMFLACGTEDGLLEENRAFHTHLETLCLPHSYTESPGAHEWAYWDAQIQRVLNWLPLPAA